MMNNCVLNNVQLKIDQKGWLEATFFVLVFLWIIYGIKTKHKVVKPDFI